jgi:hypothetical protein
VRLSPISQWVTEIKSSSSPLDCAVGRARERTRTQSTRLESMAKLVSASYNEGAEGQMSFNKVSVKGSLDEFKSYF